MLVQKLFLTLKRGEDSVLEAYLLGDVVDILMVVINVLLTGELFGVTSLQLLELRPQQEPKHLT